jgi:hypothetical protein
LVWCDGEHEQQREEVRKKGQKSTLGASEVMIFDRSEAFNKKSWVGELCIGGYRILEVVHTTS